VERPAALRLTPIDTSFSFHSNSTTATSSSTTSTANAWSSTGRRGLSNLHPSSVLSATQEENKILPSHASLISLGHRQYLHSIIPSPPLLSARSSIFLAALQHSLLSTIDTYLHRGSTHSINSNLHHQSIEIPQKLENFNYSPKQRRKGPLSHSRKVATAICSALIIAVITTTAFFASKNQSRQPKAAQHLIMGGSAAIVALAALLMLAAGRSIKEILAMAAVAFTICQCIQNDLSSSF
jgi:hypothetical protein